MVDKKTRKVICVVVTNGKRHDFRLFKESKTHISQVIRVEADTGYQGIAEIHANSILPKKRTKKNPLSKDDKKYNKEISGARVTNEHAIGFIKRFRIISERYRNRRKRFELRFNLIAGLCNFELEN